MHTPQVINILVNNFIEKSTKLIVKSNQTINQVKLFYIIWIFYKVKIITSYLK
jgi:hypothetical protein